MKPETLIYEKVRPGITGWWACNGRSATTYKKRLELEYYYIKNMSLLLDIKCIFKSKKKCGGHIGNGTVLYTDRCGYLPYRCSAGIACQDDAYGPAGILPG